MPEIMAAMKGIKKLRRSLKAESVRQDKALQTAVKVEGFRLMKLLKQEIRSGVVGGETLTPLTFLARRLHRGRTKPLRRLAVAIRYHMPQRKPFIMKIGWVGPRVSKKWKALAEMHQEGFERPVTEKIRSYLRRRGAERSKRAGSKYFFLRKSTKRFKTPKRPIIKPFWEAHKDAVWRHIQQNFRRKLSGQRI